ncbi:hypothetical protein HDU98_007466 [Podochytrium sp. JEL0797]|nr:hypothetical protein HDU98_007466 [Podochytrium sp. JEL0797]
MTDPSPRQLRRPPTKRTKTEPHHTPHHTETDAGDSDNPSDPETSQPPRARPGRKRIDVVDPDNKRLTQNRAAQRAYRERQINHVKELEARVVELSALVELRDSKVEALRAENARLVECLNAMNSKIQQCKSCADSELEFPVIPLESIKNSPTIEEYIHGYIQGITKSTTVKSVRHNVIQAIQVRRKLLDECSILERHTCIHVMEAGKTRNQRHQDYFYRCFRGASGSGGGGSVTGSVEGSGPKVGSIARTMSALLGKIPALKGVKELSDELAELSASTNLQDTSCVSDTLLRYIEIQSQLQALCVLEEDRTNLMVAMEIGRASNRMHLEEILEM